MEGTRVRRLEERDIAAAILLTDLEGWGYTPADFRRLRFLTPDGCFVAELDGRVVGVLTTTKYDGLAFLGAVIVHPELRGKGIGNTLMDAALRHLRTAGVRTVRLNAYLRAVRFYERLGFHGEYEVIRWRGSSAAARMQDVRPVRQADLGPLARMDAVYFGASRVALLTRLAEEFPDTFLVAERAGAFRGFIVGNPSGDSCEIGPWVAGPESAPIARDLYRALVGASGASKLSFSGPSPNEELREFVREVRCAEVFRTLRMWWGTYDYVGDPAGSWAVGGLEKG